MSHFGTDGIRAKAKVFDKEYLTKIAKATLAIKPGAKIILGRDPRVSGTEIEESLREAFLSYGGRVTIAGMIPTPTLAFLTKKLAGDYGIMLSASHNPPEYNGIKFFSPTGEKISDEEEKNIEFFIDNPVNIIKNKISTAEYYYGDGDYISYLASCVNTDLNGMKICLDCANGATGKIAPMLFTKLGANVTSFNTEIDGKNVNVNCGATQTDFLLGAMKEGNFDIGFSYDGDGDRLMTVQDGKLFDGDHLMYIHGKILKREGKLNNNAIVGTVMSNMGTEKACEKEGIRLIRTAVGDKFVHREMTEKGYNVGGEESGHIIFFDYMKTGDGVLASLLTAILAKKYPLKSLDDITEYPKASDCYMCDEDGAQRFRKDKEIAEYLKRLNFEGRAVVRPSGTEPKIRIMVEASSKELAKLKVKEIKEFIIRRLG